ncbi:type II secretion system protein [Helicobacter turcicus]|uniref:Type II secretion system GspH family protein n=1 Tax=Helicobacter turcicus TaxID=2867412 RepID=A0ABS7JML3_9HELI|nr:type II secretion system GspH family protein [Helicobacter turcicus]MBX7490636.1 type II secretion system GspH family protein [Helicobacter turcicus]MBX7545456.1 type II secretion system GspH family protein [Helicobacter turcicus]
MQTKKAFTMLELVFILVILGILAAVAIPKISASRDDAKFVALKSDINTLKTAFPAYFLAQGQGTFLTAITLSSANWNLNAYAITSKLQDSNQNPCISVRLLDTNNALASAPNAAQFLEFSTQTSPNANGDTCAKLVESIGLNSTLKIPLLSNSIVF